MGITSRSYAECVRDADRYCRIECMDAGELFYVRWMRESEAVKTKAALEGHGATVRVYFVDTLLYGEHP